jgi:molybdopterin/thiamine biosynthesis adenylyltransferase
MGISNIKVIGCGGIGLSLLPTLCRFVNYHDKLDEVDLHLIDGDDFEPKNQERQGFTELGNKAEVTGEAIEKEYKNLTVWTQGVYLTEDNIVFHIREDDVILACVDNHATRKLIIDRCQGLENVTLISGGNDYTDGNVSVYIRRDGEDQTKPPTELYPEIAKPQDENPGDADEDEDREGCQEEAESEPQLLIANNFVAAAMLNAFYALTEGKLEYGDVYLDVLTCQARQNDRAKLAKPIFSP